MPDIQTKTEFKFSVSELDEQALPVIIVAAGASTRMQGISKVFEPVLDVPVIIHTLRAFEKSEYISRIIVVTKSDDILKIQQLINEYAISKVSDIIEGGSSRQQSVKNGICMLGNDEKAVLIHDGARPIISQETIRGVACALKTNKSVTCAVKIKDTIKSVDSDGFAVNTLNRDELMSIQTPQGVAVKEYREALDNISDLSVFTDDTSIMESIGIRTKIVQGDYRNIKITTREDLIIAQSYLK